MKREIKRAVITGPTGAIGRALCAELAANGIEVIAVIRPASARADAIPTHARIRTVECDMSALSRLSELIPEGADAFYHFAWAHTTGAGRNDMQAQLENVRFALDAVRAAHLLGCSVFVGAGSQAEYGRVEGKLSAKTPCFPENGYGIAKLCAGQMTRIECEKYGLDHVWARVLSVYGPGDTRTSMISSVILSLLEGKKPSLTAGEQLWDYLYSGDAARAFRLMAQKGVSGKVYPLGGGSAKPLREYVFALRDAVDPALPLGIGDVPYAPLQVMHMEADISELTADTGFLPTVDFETGIRMTVDAMK